jgi:hypothetical protein
LARRSSSVVEDIHSTTLLKMASNADLTPGKRGLALGFVPIALNTTPLFPATSTKLTLGRGTKERIGLRTELV